MISDLTLKKVCELIKKDQESDPALIDAVDKLLGLTLVCAPAFFGTGGSSPSSPYWCQG